MMDAFSAYDVQRLRSYQTRGDASRIEIRKIGRSIALRFSEVGYFNRIYHVDWEVINKLPAIDEMYAANPSPFPVELIAAPCVNLSDFATELSAHGYVPGTRYARLRRSLPVNDCLGASSEIAVRSPLPEEYDQVLEIYLRGFGAPVKNDVAAKANLTLLLGHPAIKFWVALVEQQPVSLGMLFKWKRCAFFCGGATLPEFRNHGCHQALINRRFHEAARLGCDEGVSWACFGGKSHRNMESLGFSTVGVDQAWHSGDISDDS